MPNRKRRRSDDELITVLCMYAAVTMISSIIGYALCIYEDLTASKVIILGALLVCILLPMKALKIGPFKRNK